MKIACICAYPRSMNYGMLSVDLAFEDFCCDVFNYTPDVTYFNIEEELSIFCGNGRELKYKHLFDPDVQLLNFDLIVIWGDFTTSFEYHEKINKILCAKLGLSEDVARLRSFGTLLLAECSEEVLRKTIIAASNILPNSEALMSKQYKGAVKRLYQNVAAIIPRDPISTSIAQLLRGSAAGVTCGIDAAFFLKTDISSSLISGKKIGYSFGRTLDKKSPRLSRYLADRFVNTVARENLSDPVDIKWRTSKGKPENFHEKLNEMKDCQIIVTDTYHCAINALREKIPVVCIGRGAKHQFTTLGDKKKEVLFHSLLAQDMYVFSDSLDFMFQNHRVAMQSIMLLKDEQYLQLIQENIHIGRNNMIISFQSAVRSITDGLS